MTNIIPLLEKIRQASRGLVMLEEDKIDSVILALADAVDANVEKIIAANKKDLERMDPSNTKYDRLLLDEKRINAIAEDIRSVASLPSPLNKILETTVRPNGMKITKISVPFGVIGTVFEIGRAHV